ncbi:uncharacterized protein LAESUDRAFT_710625 [Laetiporus sulphureus 93-53]|uniref:Retrotransposon gag domain-containing protein n=1 Tax=Laetiporus sulphureus 93-53 TaxID=1314785 RepID=A0A165HTU3_9APHY|nr:uncharacterized protein LAESUDRAFT_710625 [Laetiporus sulphureus 93-53]KZT12179.1 hypothetical protein LAESUDRAFT_710625 [Laetiporus sulphureus 93-53]
MFLKDSNPTSWFNAIQISNLKILHDFQGFIHEFKNHFEDPDLVTKYLRELKVHMQMGSVTNYAARFCEYLIDNKAHAREIERKAAKSSSSSHHISHHHEAPRATPPPAPPSAAPVQSSTNNDIVPMKVDAIRHGPLTDA